MEPYSNIYRFGSDGLLHVWELKKIREFASRLPTKRIKISKLDDFKEAAWFPDHKTATCLAVAEHAKRIYNETFDHPIILSHDGHVMDGMHRIAKAWIAGMEEIDAIQLEHYPEPDEKIKMKNK